MEALNLPAIIESIRHAIGLFGEDPLAALSIIVCTVGSTLFSLGIIRGEFMKRIFGLKNKKAEELPETNPDVPVAKEDEE